jgi:hypothetical protein
MPLVADLSAGVFTVVGVGLGSGLTFLIQTRVISRNERFSRTERLRRERMEIYSAFAAAAMDLRRGQYDRWHTREQEGRGSERYEASKFESYRLRAAARRELYRIRLVANDVRLAEMAAEVVRQLSDMHRAADETALETAGSDTRNAIECFVDAAVSQLAEEGRRTAS